jgi:hypothetical protein
MKRPFCQPCWSRFKKHRTAVGEAKKGDVWADGRWVPVCAFHATNVTEDFQHFREMRTYTENTMKKTKKGPVQVSAETFEATERFLAQKAGAARSTAVKGLFDAAKIIEFFERRAKKSRDKGDKAAEASWEGRARDIKKALEGVK